MPFRVGGRSLSRRPIQHGLTSRTLSVRGGVRLYPVKKSAQKVTDGATDRTPNLGGELKQASIEPAGYSRSDVPILRRSRYGRPTINACRRRAEGASRLPEAPAGAKRSGAP